MAALLAKIDRLSVAYKAAVAAAAAEAAERTEAARQEEEARRKRLAAAQVAGIAIAEEPEDGSEDAGAGAGASAGVNVGRPVAKRSTLGGFTKSLRSAGSRMAASLGSILTTGHWTAKPRFVPVPVALPRARQALAAIATAASLRDQREANEDDEASPPHPMYNRTAIVVGNESYPAAVGGELEAAGENAQAVAAALVAAAPVGDSAARRHGGGAGWSSGSVTFIKDAQGAELAQRVRAAAAKLVDNDVLLLYYSGYGTETAGKLYFLMCDTHYFPPSDYDHGVCLCVFGWGPDGEVCLLGVPPAPEDATTVTTAATATAASASVSGASGGVPPWQAQTMSMRGTTLAERLRLAETQGEGSSVDTEDEEEEEVDVSAQWVYLTDVLKPLLAAGRARGLQKVSVLVFLDWHDVSDAEAAADAGKGCACPPTTCPPCLKR